jgi:hypothetical protein
MPICVLNTRTENGFALHLRYGGYGFFRYFSERESTHTSIES